MMEKSVLGGNIKTYASKKGRISNYRMSYVDFKKEEAFDKLIEDEVNKKPLTSKKSDVEGGIVRNTKSFIPSTFKAPVLKNIQNYSCVNRKLSLLAQTKKKRVRTKISQRNKENSLKCSSRLYKSNSDSDNDLKGLSVYDLDPNINPLADYKRRQALKKTKPKPKSRMPSITKDTNPNSCLSENEFIFPRGPTLNINHSNGSVDKPNLNPAESGGKVFKKPTVFVERSSDLFYKNSINKNRGLTKTRKKLSFVSKNHSLDTEYDADHSIVINDRFFSTNRSNVDELFNSDNENQGGTHCSVFFNPETASTPNFNRKVTSFSQEGDEDLSTKSHRDTHPSFRLSIRHEQSGAAKNGSPGYSPVTINEAICRRIQATSKDSPATSRIEVSNRSIQAPINEPSNLSKNESCNRCTHLTTDKPLDITKNDEIENSAKYLDNSSDLYPGSSSGDSDSSSVVLNNDNDRKPLRKEIIPQNNGLVESCDTDSHNSLYTFPGEPKSLKDLDETSLFTNIEERQDSDKSMRHSSENNSLLNFSEHHYSPGVHSPSSYSSASSNGKFEENNCTSDESIKIISQNNNPVESSDNDSCNSSYTFPGEPKSSEDLNETFFSTNFKKQQDSNKSMRHSSENNSLLNFSEHHYSPGVHSPSSYSVVSSNGEFEENNCTGDESTNERKLLNTFSRLINDVVNLSLCEVENEQKILVDESPHITKEERDLRENLSLKEEVDRSSEDVADRFSLINITPKPEVNEPSLNETIECLSPILAPTDLKVEGLSLNETTEIPYPIHAQAENTKRESFVGWSSEEYIQASESKKTFESICKELETKNALSEEETPTHLKLVTRRRKKTFMMPILNEENSDLEEESVDCCNNAKNSPVLGQELMQLGSFNQVSLCTSRFVERSSMMGHSIVLATGKKWRRSFITLKNIREYGFQSQTEHVDLKGRCWKKNVEELMSNQLEETSDLKEIAENSTRTFSNETFLNSNYTCLETFKRPSKARFSLCVNQKLLPPQEQQKYENSGTTSSSDTSKLSGDKSYFSFVGSRIENNYDLEAGDCSRSHKVLLESYDVRDHLSAKETVLRYCKQTEPLPFEECFNERLLKNCKKIGEGVYGEVFMLKRNQAHCSVLKIIPIEGDLLINGEKQKKYEEIVSELIISIELSDLRKRQDYYTDNFAELQRCWCVYGKYPDRLIDLWDAYNEEKGSDNDSPKVFDDNQLFIILELSHGGEDVESFVFNNAQQALSVFTQVAYALAVAEQAFSFEHRDLHWGNILVSKSKKERTKYIIGDSEHTVRLRGVKVTIIDYTLSRITINDCIVFNDIGQDPELFTAQGDFQFEIYRLMKNEVRDIWSKFMPKTNVYWLCYLLDKMVKEVRYRRISTQIHQVNFDRLKEFFELILGFASCHELVCHSHFKRTTSATK